MNHDRLNNLGRGSPKEHFCQVILKSVQWFLTKRFLKFFLWLLWQPESCMNFKSLNSFESVPPKDHSCEIWLKLVQWFRRICCLKKLWRDRQGQGQTVSDHSSSPQAFGSGELKTPTLLRSIKYLIWSYAY